MANTMPTTRPDVSMLFGDFTVLLHGRHWPQFVATSIDVTTMGQSYPAVSQVTCPNGHRHRMRTDRRTHLPTLPPSIFRTQAPDERWWCEDCREHHDSGGSELLVCGFCEAPVTVPFTSTQPMTTQIAGRMDMDPLLVTPAATDSGPSRGVALVLRAQTVFHPDRTVDLHEPIIIGQFIYVGDAPYESNARILWRLVPASDPIPGFSALQELINHG